MSFRDPILNTYTFTLTLYNKKGELFYAKRTKDGDTYQFGYHRAVSYRENCYQCRFAKPERNADITIADYHGLGLSAPCSFSARKVSLILENTSNGSAFVDSLIHNRCIHAEQRPLEEPFKGEAQLRHPSQKNKYRLMFEKEITASLGDFETAITKPFKRYNRDLRIKNLIYYPYRMARKIVKKITR